jgi:hypothetical protein
MAKGMGTPRKLATATQPQFPRTGISVIEHMLLTGAAQIEETAKQLAERLRNSTSRQT